MKTMYKFILIVVLLISSSAFAQTTYSWVGGSGNWSVATNWSPNGVPTATDNAVIAGTGTYTVTLDGDSTINDLTIGGTSGIQTLSLSSSTLTVNGSATINDSGHVSLSSSTLTGSGSLSNFRSISLNLSNIDLNFDNSGLINFYRSCNINGTFTTQTNSIIRLRSAYAYVSRPTFANGFTNNGLIEFITTYTGAAGRLDITSGTLVNAAGGTIHTPSAASSNNHLNAPLDNQGTIILDRSITINKASAVHSNSGTISINSGTLRLTQSGTSPSFTNTGILTVDSTTALTIDGGSFDYSSGTFTQNGSLTATNVAFTFTPAFTNAMNMSLSSSTITCASTFTNQNALSLTSTTINGSGTFTNNGTMSANNSTVDVDFDNGGFASFWNSCNINSTFTTQINSTIRLSSAYAAGAYLTIANGFTNNGLIDYTTSYSSAYGRLEVSSGILVNASGGTIHAPSTGSNTNHLYAPLDNQGTIILDRSMHINKASAVHSNNGGFASFWNSCNINSTFTTQINSTIRLSSAYAAGAYLTIANGFTNNGLIDYTTSYSSAYGRLEVSSGILVNASGGTIHAPSTGSNTNHLYAPLDNQGTIILDRSMHINKASAVHSNNGTISINNGTLTVTQSGTSPSFTTNGILTVDSTGTLAINGGSFDYTSGTFTLDGSFSATNAIVDMYSTFNTIVNNFTLDNSTLTCTSSLTNQDNMSLTSSMLYGINDLINHGNLSLTSSTIDSFTTFTNTGTMTANNGTINVDFDNDGSAIFWNSCYINNALTTQSNSIIRMSSAYAAGAYLTIANGFTNNGLIDYTTSYNSTAGTLVVTNGILVNASGGTIHAPSTGSYNNRLFAQLYNQGNLLLEKTMTIDKADAAHTNTGTISINSGTLTLTQSGTSPSFTNTGILTVDSTTALTIDGGSFDYSSGTFTQNGSLTATNVAFTFTPAFTNAMNMSLSSSTITCASTFTNQNALSLTSTTINGSGTFTNNGTMSANNSTVDVDFDNGGFASFWNSCNINSTFTTQINSTIRLSSAYAAGVYLTIANGFSNNGLIEYTTSYYNTYGRLEVSSGILVNTAGGTIQAPSTASYTNHLYAHLYNQGTIILDRSITINKASAVHSNSGTISINSGTLRLTQSGTSPSFTNTGILTVDSTTALTIDGCTC